MDRKDIKQLAQLLRLYIQQVEALREKYAGLSITGWSLTIKGNRLGGTNAIRRIATYARDLYGQLESYDALFERIAVSGSKDIAEEFYIGVGRTLVKILNQHLNEMIGYTDDNYFRDLNALTKNFSLKMDQIIR